MPTPKKTTEAEVSTPGGETKRKRAKTTTAVAADTAAQSETAAPKLSRAASSAAASHKHTAKKTVQSAPVDESRRVTREAIAKLAYSYWEARGYQGGSPEEDWLRAERELLIAS